MYFKSNKTVAYYDCDVNDNIKISAAIRLMQQTSSEHLESIRVPVQMLYQKGFAFLLTKTCLKVHHLPKATDEIVIGTAATQIKGPRFYREFTIEDSSGKHYMDALTLWILVEPETRRIIRPAECPYQLPLQESITQGAIENITLPKIGEMTPSVEHMRPVYYSFLDVNEHMNNSYYADFVCDALPYEALVQTGIDTIVLNYQREALYGDQVSLARYDLGESQYFFSGNHDRGLCFDSMVKMK